MDSRNLEFLDMVTIASFIIQMESQSKILSLHDIQEDNTRIVGIIQEHLEKQDQKINKILEVISNGNNQKSVGNDF